MLPENITSDFAYAIPVMASYNVQESVDFMTDLGGTRSFVTEDGRYGGVLFGKAEIHYYLTDDPTLVENSVCRVNMSSVEALYQWCRQRNVVHPNGHLEAKPYGYCEFSILDPSGALYTFAEFVGHRD
jgi:hypothetical protein